jgi:hypothetical protein
MPSELCEELNMINLRIVAKTDCHGDGIRFYNTLGCLERSSGRQEDLEGKVQCQGREVTRIYRR